MRFRYVAICVLVLGIALGVFYLAWYFGDQMIVPSHPASSADIYPERIVSVREANEKPAVVSLKRTARTAKQGTYGLYWNGGNALLGPVIAQDAVHVEREILQGARPPNGVPAGISYSYGPDPDVAWHLPFSEVSVLTELGPAPAWYIPAALPQRDAVVPPNSWVITVHGSNADRRQFLRFVPLLHECGLSILDITYRDDVGAPPSADHLMHLGLTEWRDLESAVRTAKSKGAQHIVLFGGSMGGAIVLQYLSQSPEAAGVDAVLLDSPMLSVPQMIRHISQRHSIPLPAVMTWLAIHVTNTRLRSDIRKVDLARFRPSVRPPTLVLQGTDDEIMPFEVARKIAQDEAASGWPMEFVEFPGADHGGVWNSDRTRAEESVRSFLQQTYWQ